MSILDIIKKYPTDDACREHLQRAATMWWRVEFVDEPEAFYQRAIEFEDGDVIACESTESEADHD